MEWESPWGIGFPGWHIECSAMSLKYLKDNLDIHASGIDHINVHHTNEIAQSEAATGKKFFNYWLHSEFLNIPGGKKMAKSEGNFFTLTNALVEKGINPLAFRYATLSVHFQKPMKYSEEIIKNAQSGLNHLQNQVNDLGEEKGNIDEQYKEKFVNAINDNLNTPQALVVVQELLKSDISKPDKLATVIDFDKVLGLGLEEKLDISDEITKLAEEREEKRKQKDFTGADEIRKQIEEAGYNIKDIDGTFVLIKK
jgi:cysteinyl-tRNA synthetase